MEMRAHWFDLLFFEPPPEQLPEPDVHVWIKGAQERETPDGPRVCVGHWAARAGELERYVEELKVELDAVVAEARHRERAYRQHAERG